MKKTLDASKTKKMVPYEEPGQPSQKLLSKMDLEMLVRKTNPAELKVAPAAFWDAEDTLKTGFIDNSGIKQQLSIVESGVLYSAKLYNDIKDKNDVLAKTLKKKLANLDEQRRNFEGLNAMKQADTDDSRRIDELQKEVSNIESEILKHSHYSLQLDHMVTRLRNNGLKFDTHMGIMEATMPAVIKEQEDVAHLKRCLNVGLGKATLVLDETKKALATARKDREALMRKRLDEVKNAEMLQEWMERRKEAKVNLALELRGDLTKSEERFLVDQISAKNEELKRLQKENEDSTKLLQDTESFFAKLKQVTGVASLENMLEKFSIQKISKLDLEKEVSEVERKLSHAKKESLHQDKMFAELKSSGAGHGDVSRSGTDKLNTDIEQSKNDLKVTKALSERLASILLELQQSSNGLLQRLSPYSDIADLDDRGSSSGDSASANGSNSKLAVLDSTGGSTKQKTLVTTLDALNQSEQILAKMLETVTSGMDNNNIAAVVSANNNNTSLNGTMSSTFPFSGTTSSANGLDSSSSEYNEMDTTVNIRVKSLKMRRADEMAAINNINASNAVVRQPKDPNANGNSGAKSSAESRANLGAAEIPSRELVKTRSERRLNEEIQKIRREKKKNKLLQQQSNRKGTMAALKAKAEMANTDSKRGGTANSSAKPGTGAIVVEDDDDAKLAADLEFKTMAMNLAAKEQREYCSKLSQSERLMADSGNARVDVMTKVQTFFDRKPELE